MIFDSAVVGRVDCNCYVLGCPDTREGVVIDAGGDADVIAQIVRKHGLAVKHFLCTHGHFDHIEGLRDLRAVIEAPIAIHEEDILLYENLPIQGRHFGMEIEPAPLCNRFLSEGDEIKFGKLALKVIHTPGHSPGSVCFQCGSDVFTGDTIFAGSIGRTDLTGGSLESLVKNAREKLLTLGDKVRLYPGHGPATTVGDEKKNNPFLAAAPL
ncbi:MAG: MBL fold metallo-hydrolase [Candidatus Eremiobacteraeota bacterium]|nr:MBL fold metallo-hydrolase [Candidatus Eremiobacteraeota bacterium]